MAEGSPWDRPYRRATGGGPEPTAGPPGSTSTSTGRAAGAAPGSAASAANAAAVTDTANWERTLIAELARDSLMERRRARRWRLGLRLGSLALLLLAVAIGWFWFDGKLDATPGRHTALVDVEGVIEADGEVEAGRIVSALQSAFDDRNTAGVILRINSPGGSPVQAGIIYDEVRRLRKLHPTIPVHAVVEDICASGGYYVAAAADRIYVNRASLIGSIGVVMSGFGFTGLMEKAGVERRLLTAGRNKGFLDSFSPESPEQQAHAQNMLDEIHRQFISVVREGRGNRLRETPDMFSGLVWTGEKGIELGLADELGTVDTVARDVIKAGNVVDFTFRDSLAERLSRRFGAAAGEAIATRLQVPAGALQLR